MSKINPGSKTAFFIKHSHAQDEDEDEEYDMASHLVEDPVRPVLKLVCCPIAVDPHADSFPKVRDQLEWSP